jgi:hypothetical protein
MSQTTYQWDVFECENNANAKITFDQHLNFDVRYDVVDDIIVNKD